MNSGLLSMATTWTDPTVLITDVFFLLLKTLQVVWHLSGALIDGFLLKNTF